MKLHWPWNQVCHQLPIYQGTGTFACPSLLPLGFLCGSVIKESTCQCRRHWFNPWVGKIPWRRAWQSIPVFLPGESQGQRSLVGYSPWGCRVRHDLATKQQRGHFQLEEIPFPSLPLTGEQFILTTWLGGGECYQLLVDRRQRSYETSYDPHDSPHPSKELLAAESEFLLRLRNADVED